MKLLSAPCASMVLRLTTNKESSSGLSRGPSHPRMLCSIVARTLHRWKPCRAPRARETMGSRDKPENDTELCGFASCPRTGESPLPSGERAVRHDLRAPLNRLPLARHQSASKSFGEQGEGELIVREHPHPSRPRTCSARATTAIDGTAATRSSWASQVQDAKPSPFKGEGTERHCRSSGALKTRSYGATQ